MRIFIRGPTSTIIRLWDVEASDTIGDVKAKVHDKEGITPGLHRLIFAGTQLENDRALSDYNLTSWSTLDTPPPPPPPAVARRRRRRNGCG